MMRLALLFLVVGGVLTVIAVSRGVSFDGLSLLAFLVVGLGIAFACVEGVVQRGDRN